MDERNPLPGRITHRLNLDSEEEQERQEQERLEREEYERQKEDKRKRKEQKKRAKEEEEMAAKLEAQRKKDERRKEVEKYNDVAKLFQPDSDSDVSFSRIKRKIEEMYPNFSKGRKHESSESDEDESDPESESDDESEKESESDEEQSSEALKKKHNKGGKMQKKARNDSDDEEAQRKKIKVAVKVEPEMSAKDKLVQDVAVRWNYALPEWPPADFDYEAELKARGYRSVEFSKFKFVDEVVNGLTKVYKLDGYTGVYRGKLGLVDVRPKQSCPSLNYFYSKTEEHLTGILKKALQRQIEILSAQQFKQNGEETLIQDLKRALMEVSR